MVAGYQVFLPLFVVTLVVLTLPLTLYMPTAGLLLLPFFWGATVLISTREQLSPIGKYVLASGTGVVILVEILYAVLVATLFISGD